MGSRIGGRNLKVRGATRAGGSPRIPPRFANSRLQISATPEVLTTPDVVRKPLTKFEELGGTAENPKPSKFGGTTLERVADNAAAEMGWEFDAAQISIQLPMMGSYTVVDRFKKPRTMVYLDGPQHDFRTDAEQQDFIQKIALEALGYLVVRLKFVDMVRDPIGAVRSVLYVV